MKYGFIQKFFFFAFRGTFTEELKNVLHEEDPKGVMKKARKEYKNILSEIDEFDKGDRFLFNILSASMFSATLMSVKNKPSKEQAREYYRKAMSKNFFMKKAVRTKGSYTEKGRAKLKADAQKSQKRANPYSWTFTVEDGVTINQYTATFTYCGICHLFDKLGLNGYIPAMCAFDYDMAEMNNTKFSREYTIAGGGEYCDCHYDHAPEGKQKRRGD